MVEAMLRLEPDPCIPVTDGFLGYPSRLVHTLVPHKRGGFAGAELVLWAREFCIGRYVWPRADLRPDGLRILKGF